MTVELAVSRADRINRELDLAEESARSALVHWINAGELLVAQKRRMEFGEWGGWLAEQITHSERKAQMCMQLFERRDDLEAANPQGISELSISQALRQLSKPKRLSTAEIGAVFGSAQAAGPVGDGGEQPAPRTAGDGVESSARDRVRAEVVVWSDQQRRKRSKAADLATVALASLDNARDEGLSRLAVAETLRDAARQFQRAAVEVENLALTFER